MTAALALTDTERETMQDMRRAGRTLREIGQATSRHFTTVHAVVTPRDSRDRHDRVGDARACRAAIARSQRLARHERTRLLGLDDDTMLEARDECLLNEARNPVHLAAAVPGLNENMARLWLRVFWWVSRPAA